MEQLKRGSSNLTLPHICQWQADVGRRRANAALEIWANSYHAARLTGICVCDAHARVQHPAIRREISGVIKQLEGDQSTRRRPLDPQADSALNLLEAGVVTQFVEVRPDFDKNQVCIAIFAGLL
jgi:hypothetical protein